MYRSVGWLIYARGKEVGREGCAVCGVAYLGPMCPLLIFFAKLRCMRFTVGDIIAAPGPSLMSSNCGFTRQYCAVCSVRIRW